MTDERFDQMIQEYRNDHRKLMQTLDRVHQEANDRLDRIIGSPRAIDRVHGNLAGNVDRLHGTIDRIEGSLPSTAFIVFWMGVVPVVGTLAGIWFFLVR